MDCFIRAYESHLERVAELVEDGKRSSGLLATGDGDGGDSGGGDGGIAGVRSDFGRGSVGDGGVNNLGFSELDSPTSRSVRYARSLVESCCLLFVGDVGCCCCRWGNLYVLP